MNAAQIPAESEIIRVALVRRDVPEVLAESVNGTFQIPKMTIRRDGRLAEVLGREIRSRWLISPILIEVMPGGDIPLRCAVLEVRPTNLNTLIVNLSSCGLGCLAETEITPVERTALADLLDGNATDRGPFARFGWIDEVQAWIRDNVSPSLVFTDDIRQSHAGPAFSLVRIGTSDGHGYWLKATSAPNVHELAVTQYLSSRYPHFLPRFIASRSDWNAWITEDSGLSLDADASSNNFVMAAETLGRLQASSIGETRRLLAAGCFDQRLHVFRSRLPRLIQYLEDIMAAQTSTRVLPLTPNELHKLHDQLATSCSMLGKLGIPEALIHNDPNLGNFLISERGVLLTDWAEAGVGIPFVTLHHLRAQALEINDDKSLADRITQAYIEAWKPILNKSQITCALSICAPLAIASYLCGRDPAFEAPYRSNESVQSYSRALAREMLRLASDQEFREVISR